MTRLTYFVHCTTTDNERGLATGWLPGELSELGKQQAAELATIVASQVFDVVICSDLHRAIQTTEIVFGNRFPVVHDARLREANYGEWNGKSAQLFKSNMENFIDTPFPGGESYRDVEARMRAFCKDLQEKYPAKRVALVAHQAPQLALEVICHHKIWPEAIATDWRRTGAYQPGWRYSLR